jgi:Ca2+-binding EF-hand superfamily protein
MRRASPRRDRRRRHPRAAPSALKDLFAQIDGDGDGKITNRNSKTRSAPAAPTRRTPTSVFGKLDKDGDGSVSLKELASALKGGTKLTMADKAPAADRTDRIPIRSRRPCRALPPHPSPTATVR